MDYEKLERTMEFIVNQQAEMTAKQALAGDRFAKADELLAQRLLQAEERQARAEKIAEARAADIHQNLLQAEERQARAEKIAEARAADIHQRLLQAEEHQARAEKIAEARADGIHQRLLQAEEHQARAEKIAEARAADIHQLLTVFAADLESNKADTEKLEDNLYRLEKMSEAQTEAIQRLVKLDEQRLAEIAKMWRLHDTHLNVYLNHKESISHIYEMIEKITQQIDRLFATVEMQYKTKNNGNQ